jgi:hypothetical protein
MVGFDPGPPPEISELREKGGHHYSGDQQPPAILKVANTEGGAMSGARSGDQALDPRKESPSKKAASFEDLLIPVIPGMITSLTLEALSALNGLQKIGIATLAGAGLWGLTQRRSGKQSRVPAGLRRHWRWAILGLACVSLVALTITVIVYGRPTPTTVTVSTLAFAILGGTAAQTRQRLPGALAGAVSGGIIGLCVGIALG